MDIDEFYAEDPRRRQSAELELGTEWTDDHEVRYELNFVSDTGELFVMQEPPPKEWVDPFGGIYVKVDSDDTKMLVRVVAKVDSVEVLHTILEGWQEAMAGEGGVAWLADRLRVAGVAVTDG